VELRQVHLGLQQRVIMQPTTGLDAWRIYFHVQPCGPPHSDVDVPIKPWRECCIISIEFPGLCVRV
jgi:hypothetical protein